ncbi:MAG: SDR family oxidoreductase [Synergistaceae bacterium]|nr:SDR family oxidoreductase [Synergistaceae bacterium]
MDYDREYFNGKTAAVTGAASGIGLALVEELLRSDASKVVMADINPDNLKKHEDRLNGQYNGRVKGILCNVMIEEEVVKFISEAADFFGGFGGKFDLLINNAGAGFDGWFADMSNADWKTAFDLNFFSALYGMRAVLPTMVKQGGGQIINIISGIAFVPLAKQSRYTATKAALNALSISLRAEYWDDNIKISSATPGTTATAIWGGGPVPETAQTPQQSASRILNGAVNNDRIIFGDDNDVDSCIKCHDPSFQKEMDQQFLKIARERRKGNIGF